MRIALFHLQKSQFPLSDNEVSAFPGCFRLARSKLLATNIVLNRYIRNLLVRIFSRAVGKNAILTRDGYNKFSMTNTPIINRILFGLYVFVVLVVGTAALIWPSFRSLAFAPLRDLLFPNLFLPTQASAPVTLKIAVPPALESWVKVNATDFNAQNQFIKVEVNQLRGLDASQRLNTLTGQADAWIAEADFARKTAGNIAYETDGKSLAQTGFLWVVVKGRGELVGKINWVDIANSAASDPQFRIAMPPINSIEGMAACWSAASAYHRTATPSVNQVNDPAFRKWLAAFLLAAPDRNRSPRDQLATRPPLAEAGLILESDWTQLAQASFNSQPAGDGIVFNYPYYMRTHWQNLQPEESQAQLDAAIKFRDFLLSRTAQDRLADYGLMRVSTPVTNALWQVDDAVIRALQFCWQ